MVRLAEENKLKEEKILIAAETKERVRRKRDSQQKLKKLQEIGAIQKIVIDEKMKGVGEDAMDTEADQLHQKKKMQYNVKVKL